MDEERQRVLRMLKAGRITVEEAEALLEALGEEQVGPAASTGTPDAGTPAARPADARRDDLQGLIDEIMASIDVEGIVSTVRASVDTVRESLRRSKVDVHRIRGDVRRAAREARRRGIRFRITEAIEGLWGMVGAAGAWSHDAVLEAGQRVTVHNLWGDTRLSASTDGHVHARASIRAWGRDDAEAAATRDRVRITAGSEGQGFAIRAEPRGTGTPRRVRVDFDLAVPPGISVAVTQTKGDLQASEIEGHLTAHLMSGDIAVAGARGILELRTLRGDIVIEAAGGQISAHSKSGDLVLRRPTAAVALDLSTVSGDVEAEVGQFVAGSISRLATVSGDLTTRLGPRAGCRVNARVASGEIRTGEGLDEVQRGQRSLQGVHGSSDATLDLSTMSGDILIVAVPYSP
ncbi:MAG: DUF4097 family beta strand repeat-containing protein [bacterium]|nr:DUF4097 family beta strand repeat-containing protein [bacterium]